jgi:hypothetical protein
MTATTTHSSAELSKHLAIVEGRLAAAQAKLHPALRAAALAFLGDRANDEVNSVRAEIRKLQDLAAGLRDVSVRAEVDELDAEIERREQDYEAETSRLETLRRAGTRQDAVIEGAGPSFGAELRADREQRNVAFSVYEAAHHAHLDERKAIDALNARRAELERQFPDAFDD